MIVALRVYLSASILLLAAVAPPLTASASDQDWRSLCEPEREVEILIGGSWYRGTVTGPDINGEAYCGVLNTSYTGRDMHFSMAPDRMRAVHSSAVDAGGKIKALPPASQTLEANLAQIGEAYRTNVAAARQRYEGLTVTLSGTLERVGSDYVRLTDGPFGVAMCTFNEADRHQLAELIPGSMLTVQGDDSSWGWDTFQLVGCRVIGEQAMSPAQGEEPVSTYGGLPAGRYVCRQYMTTIGWIDLNEGVYVVNGVQGTYSFDPGTGAIVWLDGAYRGWPARFEYSPAGSGHAHDEYIIRMTDETDTLRINCFLTSE